ncbi:MAG TPA: hypothetical protein VEA16_16675 [Vicinamibacterales bacterium]|nr:hypothetical protein [Vicinamibacterales bacterium]
MAAPFGRGKRERERARAEKQKQKAERREEAKHRRNQPSSGSSAVDPDIAGIVPGPQPNPWMDDADSDVPAETEKNE